MRRNLPTSFAIVAAVLAIGSYLAQGAGAQGLHAAARVTARLAALLFALTFSAAALKALHRRRWTAWLRSHRRQLGLSFGAVHLVHLGVLLALAIFHTRSFVPELGGVQLVGGGLAYAVLVAMMLSSNDRAQQRMGVFWGHLHRVGGWYLWLLFTRSYGVRVQVGKAGYLPLLGLFLAVGALRAVAHFRSRNDDPRPAQS